MKLVQYVLAAGLMVLVAACGADGSSTGGIGAKCEDVDSTYGQIQAQIFEGRGCTAAACHGEAAQAGLDLRADASYEAVVNVAATSGDYVRVFPGEQELSLLFQKVAAKVDGFDLTTLEVGPISGGAMPTGPDVLSDDDLALLRSWIRGGAPRNGIVAGSEEFATCELEGEIAPNKIQPLPAPPADEGVQFYSGAWTVPAEQEGEICFVTYYDYSAQVPEEVRVPCGEAEGGPDRECFVVNKTLLAQDPQSHHSIVEFYVPPAGSENQYDPNGASWKNWQCLGGDNDGAACVPGGDECGARSQCTTAPTTTIACTAYPNGPRELGAPGGLFGTASVRQSLFLAQESSYREFLPEDVFQMMPVKGFMVWDSHAFNLTKSDTTIEQWINMSFADPDRLLYQRRQIFDADDIFGMGLIDAYSSTEVCASYTAPQYARILSLASHTHRFGKEFRIWYPPNQPCMGAAPNNGCEPAAREADYVSYDYSDPLYQRFSGDDILAYDSPDPVDRTFLYCSRWDNGETNPDEVRRDSIKPNADTCDFVATFAPLAAQAGINVLTCGCEPEERSCFGGPNVGMACNGDDSVCGEGGVCDACPAGGGVTTEEEMFIMGGSLYVETPFQ